MDFARSAFGVRCVFASLSQARGRFSDRRGAFFFLWHEREARGNRMMALQPNQKVKNPHPPADWKTVSDISTKHCINGRREAKPPMGADLMRWMFCRQNPASNINFGSGPAEELRSKFTLKLWNSYSFFCLYARPDGFDPAAPPVPIAKRPDLDRWILSDLQLLVQTARKEFEAYK